MIRCSKCPEVFGSRSLLDFHTNVAHPKKRARELAPMRCGKCTATFETAELALAHDATHAVPAAPQADLAALRAKHREARAERAKLVAQQTDSARSFASYLEDLETAAEKYALAYCRRTVLSKQ